MNDTVEKLKAARALIERGWCQGEYAKDADGEAVGVREPRAVAWCVRGACYAANVSALPLYDVQRDLTNWNDHPGRTQAEVLNLFDEAIALATNPT